MMLIADFKPRNKIKVTNQHYNHCLFFYPNVSFNQKWPLENIYMPRKRFNYSGPASSLHFCDRFTPGISSMKIERTFPSS